VEEDASPTKKGDASPAKKEENKDD